MVDTLAHWLLTPWSGAADHAVAPAVAWHARLMVLAWGMAIPLAVLLARYFKVVPGQDWPRALDHKAWWHGHRLLNYAAVLLTAAAVVLVWPAGRYSGIARDLHAWLGWTVAVLAVLQVLSGVLRGSKGGPTAPRRASDGHVLDLQGDHYDMTRRRRVFEHAHKGLGWMALGLSVGAIVLGLRTADAPRWMWLLLPAWWALLVVLAVHWQRQGRCIDTYQAIWGADPRLPGATVAPIGWGVRRLKPHESPLRIP